MPSHGDFELPGLTHDPRGYEELITAIAMAYSANGMANRRRLEDPLYGFWNKVFLHLVFDLRPQVIGCPQLRIYEAAANNLDPDASIATVPGEWDERIPDFTLLCVFVVERTKPRIICNPVIREFEDWDSFKVVGSKPFSFAEAKRMPSRHIDSKTRFQKAFVPLMESAQQDADNQADIAFREPNYKLDTVILVAMVGEWWSFKFSGRAVQLSSSTASFLDNYPDNVEDEDEVKISQHEDRAETSDDSEDGDPSYIPGPTKRAQKHKQSKPRPPPVLRTTHMVRMKDLHKESMDIFQDNVEAALPRLGGWSKNIRYGTKVSNQRFYLIHRELKRMKDAFQVDIEKMLAEQTEDTGYRSGGTDEDGAGAQ